ncbi:MAG: hypothetical protein WCL43_07320 [Chlorobium sp.]|jgi:hypothetical protein|nr:MAG: hypothetical protein FDX12_07530 [Chlorobium sp.]
MSVKPVDLNKLRSGHSNLYETVVAISKKAKRLHDDERAELEERLLPWKDMTRNPTSESESDKVFPEQIAISLEFECREKSSHKAVTDYFEHKYDYTIDKPTEKKVVITEEDDETDGD